MASTPPVPPEQMLQRRREGAAVTVRLPQRAGVPHVETDAGRVRLTDRGGETDLVWGGLPAGGPYRLRAAFASGQVLERVFYVGDLWLLAGQSNMEGVGLMDGAAEPHPLVRSFSMARVWGQAVEPLHFLAESPDQVHHGGYPMTPAEAAEAKQNAVRGSGVGLPFARLMAQRTGVPQGLICTAHGGTSMAQWSPGRPLYASMLASLLAVGQPLAGVLWYQGCSDTNTAEDAQAYTGRMIRLVETLRADVGQPDLPWLTVQIGTEIGRTTGTEWWHSVQDEQRRLPSRLPALDVCAAADLEHDDWIHVSARAFPRLAERLAVLADRLVHGVPGTFPAPSPLRVRYTRDEFSPVLTLDCEHVAGGWVSTGLPLGFALRDAEGRDRPLIYQVRFEGSSVKLRLTDDDLAGVSLFHGTGAQPQINTFDGRGMPLPVFGPLPIEDLPPYSPWFRTWLLGPLSAVPLAALTPAFWAPSATWETLTTEGWNVVNRHDHWAGQDGVQVGQTTWETPVPRRFRVLAGGDGPLRVWLDDEPVIDDPAEVRDLAVVRTSARLVAAAGRHTITVAMNNRGGQSYGFFLRLEYED